MPKKRRFKSLGDVRRFLAYVLNSMDSGDLEPQLGSKMAYVANIMVKCIEGSDLEKRIEELEKSIGRQL